MARAGRLPLALALSVAAAAGLAFFGHDKAPHARATEGIHKIRHVVVIMQENRSFDSYFGTYPGADGLPRHDGVFTVCAPDPRTGCLRPFHDTSNRNSGGPHEHLDAIRDVNRGKMNGFVREARRGLTRGCGENPDAPLCSFGAGRPDVMGYHDEDEIPNYWAYARNFVLQDHMFESVSSWSLPQHLYTVSEWSARCRTPTTRELRDRDREPARAAARAAEPHRSDAPLPVDRPDLPAAQGPRLLALLRLRRRPARLRRQRDGLQAQWQNANTPGIWNPLPWFSTVHRSPARQHRPDAAVLQAARAGTLPAVSWLTPSNRVSEHPPALVTRGQAYVTSAINAIMSGPDWGSTAIFLGWDDWGGFYDHVMPPKVDGMGFGLRVPSLIISPYAKRGYIDHQVASLDAYTKFIEDDFLGGQRIDPRTDGRPDSRPDVREVMPQVGDLTRDFDFSQPPRPPMLLPEHPGFS